MLHSIEIYGSCRAGTPDQLVLSDNSSFFITRVSGKIWFLPCDRDPGSIIVTFMSILESLTVTGANLNTRCSNV